MKKLFIFIIVIMTALVGCEQEDFVGTGLEALSDFTLNPLPESTIELSSVNPDEEIVISWNAANSGLGSEVKYTWQAYKQGDDPSNIALNMPSDEGGTATTLTLTQQALDEALEGLGLGVGEAINIVWFVSATNGDITKQTNTSTVTVKRFVDEIAPFDLISPPDNTALDLDIDNATGEVIITWDSTYSGFASDITYMWLADMDGGDFSNPVLSVESDVDGTDNQVTFTQQQLDDALAALGLAQGEVASLDWKVIASTTDLSKESTSTFSIDIRRFDTKVDFKIVLTKSADVPAGLDVFVAGEFGKLGVAAGDWQEPGTNPDLQLIYNSTDDQYELTLRVPEANIGTTFQFKYFLATTASPSWGNGEQIFNSSGCGGAPNREVTFNMAAQVTADEVAAWEGYCPPEPAMQFLLTVTDNFPTSADVDVYIAGSLGFVAWPQPGTDDRLKLTSIGGNQYEVYLPVPNGHTGEFKFFLATKETPSWGNGEQQVNGTNDGCEGVGNRGFTFTGSESVNATVDVWEGFCPF